MKTAREIWEKALGELQVEVSKPNYNTWLKDSHGVGYRENVFTVGVPNSFVAEWLSLRLASLIQKTLAGILNRNVEVLFTVHAPASPKAPGRAIACPTDGGTSLKTRASNNGLISRYTFSNFVVGDSSRLAYAAAMEAAENPGRTWNPLFIYSDTGQGKTHLLHAIAHAAIDNGFKVACLSAEQFTRKFISAVRQKQSDPFHDILDGIHILLFDDIQFLSNKKQTQQYFFHIFNALYENGKQLVITANSHPAKMALFNKDLTSRFEGGLFVNIQSPDEETRLSILRAKAKQLKFPLQENSLTTIAKMPHSNVRQLEGTIASIAARSRLLSEQPTLQTINKLLTDTASGNSHNQIIEMVSTHFHVSVEDLCGQKRTNQIVQARQVAMYLMRENLSLSLSEIGKQLGGKNHATVLYSYNKVKNALKNTSELRNAIKYIQNKFDAAS